MQQRLGPTNYIINPLLGSTGTLEQAVLLESSEWRLQHRLEFPAQPLCVVLGKSLNLDSCMKLAGKAVERLP